MRVPYLRIHPDCDSPGRPQIGKMAAAVRVCPSAAYRPDFSEIITDITAGCPDDQFSRFLCVFKVCKYTDAGGLASRILELFTKTSAAAHIQTRPHTHSS